MKNKINYFFLFIIIILIILLYFFISKKNNLVQENFEDKKLKRGEIISIVFIVFGSLIIIGVIAFIIYDQVSSKSTQAILPPNPNPIPTPIPTTYKNNNKFHKNNIY